MARKLRVEYPGVIYHVMNRGDRREPIFKDEADRQRFVETLGEACAKTSLQVHAFVLMPKLFHLPPDAARPWNREPCDEVDPMPDCEHVLND